MAGADRWAAAERRGVRVEFQGVTKTFAARRGAAEATAVENLSLVIPPGEICVLVGPSGCGKTTTLKMINRLVQPTAGRILIDGQDIATLDVVALRRRIGYVIQQVGLFPHQTIAENVATVPKLLGWPRDRIRSRVEELLHLVGLDPGRVWDRYPAELSGGERQRVGVARALAAEPPLLLMDEPFGAVDPLVRERLQDEFLRIHARLRMTVVFVTHDLDEAIKLGSRVAVMRFGGRLEQYAPPWELLARPASDYVAQFVGADRALKWLALVRIGDLALDPIPASPPARALRAELSARDALAVLLTVPESAAQVLDPEGRPCGVLTIAHISALLQATSPGATPWSGGRDTDAGRL